MKCKYLMLYANIIIRLMILIICVYRRRAVRLCSREGHTERGGGVSDHTQNNVSCSAYARLEHHTSRP